MVSFAGMGREGYAISSATIKMLSLFFFLCVFSSVFGQLSDDKMTLLEFKGSVSDPDEILKSWSGDSSCHCSWFGVSCNSSLRVTGLEIGGNFSLSPSCSLNSQLTLHGFGITRNCSKINGRLVGKISAVIGNLTELWVLSLPFNELDGEIFPPIWGLKKLEVLDLERNFIHGNFSSYEFAGLRKLKVLNLGFNRIFGGFPYSFSKCTGLRILNLAGNKISGIISGFSGGLSKLGVVNLSFNRLVGSIPGDFGYDCANLEHLDLSFNYLKGEIPRVLGKCNRLRTLLLSSNRLHGVIPNELGELGSIEVLDVSRNYLSGPLPWNLGNCTRLLVLVFTNRFDVSGLSDSNSFRGSDLEAITNLPLKIIWAPSANLDGNFPIKWGSCKSLQVANLAQNSLTGEVSVQFTGCAYLRYLNLSSNRLKGKLDKNLQLPCITMFDISGNISSGPIPNSNRNISCSSI